MNRRKLPGVATATKRLADGSVRKYYYAWRGGPLLTSEDGKPLAPNDPLFIVAYAAAHTERTKPVAGTLFSLIVAYKASTEFTTLSDFSKKAYRRYLKMIEEEFGTMPLSVVQDRRARGKFKAWRATMADNPRTTDYAWTTIARVLAVAKDHGTIAINVCERGGRLYESDRADIIWLDEHITAFCAAASTELQFALLIALWTGQRQGDLIKITWSQYDGTHIRLQVGKRRKGKAKKRVLIPVGSALKTALDARRPANADGPILRNTLESHGPVTDFERPGGKPSTGRSSATSICISTTYGALLSHGWLWQAAQSRRLLRSRGTA
ncbi:MULTISPECIES: integrase [unclassified Tardiphaga]|uniref:integrase n=1 Tax=unclassified Tardiphaga TaxID=2631404 RepID=UPI001FF06855|nr:MULTISPECIES: integrase [unclassified Tardiphaga]